RPLPNISPARPRRRRAGLFALAILAGIGVLQKDRVTGLFHARTTAAAPATTETGRVVNLVSPTVNATGTELTLPVPLLPYAHPPSVCLRPPLVGGPRRRGESRRPARRDRRPRGRSAGPGGRVRPRARPGGAGAGEGRSGTGPGRGAVGPGTGEARRGQS